MVEKDLPFFSYRPVEETSDRLILFHGRKSAWISVNGTVEEIARLLAGGESVQRASLYLKNKYGVSEETAQADIRFVRDQLNDCGFRIPEDVSIADGPPRVRSAFFHLTSRCNLSCVHCYVSNPERSGTEDLPVSLVLKIIDELENVPDAGITLSGGEPLLHPRIKRIIRYASGRLKIQLLTNGVLIDREWAEFLSDNNVRVQISIDGSSASVHDQIRGKGSFDKTIRGLKFLQAVGMKDKINFSTTVMNQNLHDLAEIIALAQRLEAPLVRFLPLRKKGSAWENWSSTGYKLSKSKQERFYDYARGLQGEKSVPVKISCGLSGLLLEIPEAFQRDDTWCSVGKQIVVTTNGDVYPCPLLMAPQFKLGNAHSDPLDEILRSDSMADVCLALVERRQKIEKCAACTWRNLCQAGCMGQALDNKGTIWDTDDFCDYRKRAYKEAFDRILRIEDP